MKKVEVNAVELAKDSLDIGLVVGDIEKSLTFYKDTLGLKYLGVILKMPDDAAKKGPIFNQGFTLHGFQVGTTMLKLLAATTPPSGEKRAIDSTAGIRYLTFIVKDVNSIYDDLSSKGVEFLSKPIEIPGVKITIAMMLDPDGNHLELVSRG